ncbi:hypothetical protein [Paenibacillus tengchongensis]|uniref:hypothetical protein n=1 Tax=Paenibacillus tengchongensis TaxID=2608684 RepID=UPI00124C8F67|nr:hypothetical protein [Paenibacillus tengchongensis]
MNDFYSLKLLDRMEGLIRRTGVDYRTLRLILQTKLTMDGRRTPTVMAANRKDTEASSGSPLRVHWIYLLFGLVLIPFVVVKGSYIFTMGLTFGLLMFLISTTLISDFSAVMLDLREKNILHTKPIDKRTLNMAKSIHILLYLMSLTLTIAGPSLLVSLFSQGVVFFLLYGAGIILLDCFILVFTALCYLVILRLFDGEKLKDIINYVQIVLTVGLTVGYQFVSRLVSFSLLDTSFTPDWWYYAIPPVWFAAPFEWFVGGNGNAATTALTLLALAVPLLLLAAYIRLMPMFERSLQKLAAEEAGGRDNGVLARRLSAFFCQNRQEATFFRFTWSMMKNERDFKLRTYPTVGLSMALPFIFILNIAQGSGGVSSLKSSPGYLAIYGTALLMMTVVQMLRYSVSYKGAWIYKALPLQPGALISRGVLKAAVLRLLLPVFAVEAVIFTVLFGPRIIPELGTALLALLLYSVICWRIFPQALPFAEKYEQASRKEFTGISFLLLFIMFGFGLLHYLSTRIPAGIVIYSVILAAANVWGWRSAFGNKTLQGERAAGAGV